MLLTLPTGSNPGPNGPRNVVYNCDIVNPKSGVWTGGINEGWIFAHNRFTARYGPGIFAQKGSFDHIFADNVFVLKDTNQPAFFFRTSDCVGWELLDNKMIGGNGQLSAGLLAPLVDKGNAFLPPGDAPRLVSAVLPIFEWQRGRR